MPVLVWAVLCDFALIDSASGKVSLIGEFDGVLAESFPAKQTPFFMAARWALERKERCRFSVCVRFEDDTLFSIGGKMTGATDRPAFGQKGITKEYMLINFRDLEFKEPGDYTIEITIDNEFFHALPLYVRKGSPNPKGGTQ